jgi:hypothetical protein
MRKQRRTSIFENLIQGSEFGTKRNEIRQPNRFEVVVSLLHWKSFYWEIKREYKKQIKQNLKPTFFWKTWINNRKEERTNKKRKEGLK